MARIMLRGGQCVKKLPTVDALGDIRQRTLLAQIALLGSCGVGHYIIYVDDGSYT